jgi:trypsin
VQTNRSIEFNILVQPIAIQRSRLRLSRRGVVAGWGHTEGGNHLNPDFRPVASNDLNFINVNVLTHAECTFRLSGWAFYLNRDHICSYGGRGVGICTFDSGSPLTVDGELVGVAIIAIPCAINFPDYFARVSSYLRWIDSFITDL